MCPIIGALLYLFYKSQYHHGLLHACHNFSDKLINLSDHDNNYIIICTDIRHTCITVIALMFSYIPAFMAYRYKFLRYH